MFSSWLEGGVTTRSIRFTIMSACQRHPDIKTENDIYSSIDFKERLRVSQLQTTLSHILCSKMLLWTRTLSHLL